MDNFWLESEILWVGYKCPKCGFEDHEQVEGTYQQGCGLAIHDMTCSNCDYEFYLEEECEEEDEE